jgi:hypothetical protein
MYSHATASEQTCHTSRLATLLGAVPSCLARCGAQGNRGHEHVRWAIEHNIVDLEVCMYPAFIAWVVCTFLRPPAGVPLWAGAAIFGTCVVKFVSSASTGVHEFVSTSDIVWMCAPVRA